MIEQNYIATTQRDARERAHAGYVFCTFTLAGKQISALILVDGVDVPLQVPRRRERVAAGAPPLAHERPEPCGQNRV